MRRWRRRPPVRRAARARSGSQNAAASRVSCRRGTIGAGGAWPDRVDGDASAAQLAGEHPGHLLDPRLGGEVDTVARDWRALEAHRDVDDAPARFEPGGCFPHRMERTEEIGLDDRLEFIVGEGRDFPADRASGVVDQNAHRSERLFGRIEQRLDLVRTRHVGADSQGTTACGGDRLGDFLRLRRIPCIIDDDGVSVMPQAAGDRGADPAGRAGDDGDLGGRRGGWRHDRGLRCC